MHMSHLVATALAAVTVACGGSSPTSPNPSNTVGVSIQDFTFSPATVTIKAGTTVRWTNKGPSAHTTVSDAGAWTSPTLGAPVSGGGGYGGGGSPGGTFEFTFTQPGDYPYHCSIHPPASFPGFTGIVKVTS
jgi:plastocyanin